MWVIETVTHDRQDCSTIRLPFAKLRIALAQIEQSEMRQAQIVLIGTGSSFT